MRWFFLFFLILLAFVVNIALLDKISIMRLFAAGAFNLFIVALAGLWWHAYFRQNDIGSKIPHYCGVLILLVAALFLALLGAEEIISDSCEILIRHNDHFSRHRLLGELISGVMSYIQSVGYCRESGFVLTGIGLAFVLFCINWLISLKRNY